jgi:hypothetical protein
MNVTEPSQLALQANTDFKPNYVPILTTAVTPKLPVQLLFHSFYVPEHRFWGRGEKKIGMCLVLCGEKVASCGDVPEGSSLLIGSFQ